jgi:protein TonB
MSLQSMQLADGARDGPRNPAAPLAAVAAEPWTRSVYTPTRSGPFAFGSSLVIVGGLIAALATISAISAKPAKKPAALIKVVDLQQPPPPAPKHQATPPPAAPKIVAPPPIIQLPAQPVLIATTETPPPVVDVAPGPPSPPAEAAPPSSGSAGTSVDAGDLSARMIDATPPVYPEECRRRREQGTVTLAVQLDADGRVAIVNVATSSGFYRLDRAALNAVRHWRWSPMKHNGQAMIVRGFVTLPFVLRGI